MVSLSKTIPLDVVLINFCFQEIKNTLPLPIFLLNQSISKNPGYTSKYEVFFLSLNKILVLIMHSKALFGKKENKITAHHA
jgi:hypothetical protein